MSHQPLGHANSLFPPLRYEGRSVPSRTTLAGSRAFPAKSPLPAGATGSFSTDLNLTKVTDNLKRPDFDTFVSYQSEKDAGKDAKSASERRQAEFREKIEKETKIKIGSENLLEALISKHPKQSKEQRLRVESELSSSNRKIAQLKHKLDVEIQRSRQPSPTSTSRLSQLFRNAPPRSPHHLEPDEPDYFEQEETESPTFILAELLQALEVQGLPSEYYVEQANHVVELFKKYHTLKYDLVWAVLGVRVQSLLLSDSREVIAAGYRLMRYAMTDRRSLQVMRSLHIDYLTILSLVKESKASVEREQALKFVRAFLDVKDGIHEVSPAVVRVIAAVAEHHDDRLRNICILTLAEILIRAPALIKAAGAMGMLTDAFAEGSYQPLESLTNVFLYLLDTPARRVNLSSGAELVGPLAMFTDSSPHSDEKLKATARVVSALLRSWAGLVTLSSGGFVAVQSLTASLCIPSSRKRDVLLELIFDVLRIKPPSWSSPYLAGRRLTTYGRVSSMKTEASQSLPNNKERDLDRQDLVDHFTAALLGSFLHAGLLQSLLFIINDESDPGVKRKTTLLITEVLNMASSMLPNIYSMQIQVLPSLFRSASSLQASDRHISSNAICQIDKVHRTLLRTGHSIHSRSSDFVIGSEKTSQRSLSDLTTGTLSTDIEEGAFRGVLLETHVLTTVNFTKWRWDLIQTIIDGPLRNPKRLDEAIRATKFVKRLLGFYRPFKYRFSEVRNSKPNQRYVRAGCTLLSVLLQSTDGARYLADNKLLRQIAECLAQVDRLSGLTSSSPLFSADRLSETLTGGYFAMLGVVSGHPKGLLMMERWKMANMFYHIVELQDRDDLIKALLHNMDYVLDSHMRIILSKALTSCSTDVRVFGTRVLRKYATRRVIHQASGDDVDTGYTEWAIQLAITQLYDPEVEVCEAAVKVLEEACNDTASLEYVVRCRPALDHLGEISAPLLLRFLSTSVGYRYLDDLDYITHEMDDWFLGRNDVYVSVVEASMARALAGPEEKTRLNQDDGQEQDVCGVAPPHFYQELTRTAEGCKLLEGKGHFNEFVAIIRMYGMEHKDSETMLKAKGAMWAVGNVGAMELGAPFLQSTDVVELIIGIAEGSEVMSMRGTAFFVLGLICRSIHGQEILAQHGWEVVINNTGTACGICLPADFKKLFAINPWKHSLSDDTDGFQEDGDTMVDLTEDDPVNSRILSLISDLGNTVLAKSRASELHRIKADKAAGFRSPQLFHKVMAILSRHHFRLPVLHFVINLFDKSVMRRIIFDEEISDVPDVTAHEAHGNEALTSK